MDHKPVFHHAEEAANHLPPILVEADRVASTVMLGVHGRKKVGQGDSFWQFRPYQSGESARRIDWRQSAKTQQYYVREFEWEAAQTVWFWRDSSASMSYSADRNRPDKRHRAEVLTLALASLIVRGGEQIGLLGDPTPPGGGRAALQRLAKILERHDSANALQSLPAHGHMSRHAEMVLIGDFLSPIDEIEDALKRYSHRHVRGHLLQVLDPSEESLPFKGRVQFKGLENEGDAYFGNVEAIRSQYQERLAIRRARLAELAHSLGWSFHRHTTDRPAESALLPLYQALTQQGVSR